MDPTLIQRILQQMRGGSAPTSPQQPSAFMLNQGLENQAQAQGAQAPVHPMIQQIMQRMGLLGFLRNRTNQQMIDPAS